MTDENLMPFMETAELMVTELLGQKGFSDERLAKLELFLSAHLVTLRSRQLKSEKFGSTEDTFLGYTSMLLTSSLHGQTAIVLDTSGTLADLGKSMSEVEVIS